MKTPRLFLLFLILAAFVIMGANTQFGFRTGSHGTSTTLPTGTASYSGHVDRSLIFFAAPNDSLDSLGWYGSSAAGTGNDHKLRVAIYQINDNNTLSLPESLVYLDTFLLIDESPDSEYTIVPRPFAFTPKRWYTLAICTTDVAGISFFLTASPNTGELNRTYSATNIPNPWTSTSTSDTKFELWGNVRHTAASGTRTKVTFVSERDTAFGSTTTNFVASKPASVANGDVLIACIVKGDEPAITTFPTNWVTLHYTELVTAGDDQTVYVGYKIITNAAGEPSTYTWVGDVEQWSGGIACFRGVDTAALADCSPLANYSQNLADPICPSLTTRTDSSMLVVFATASLCDTGSVTNPSGSTGLWFRKATGATADFNGSMAAYNLIETAGSTGTQTFNCTDTSSSDAYVVSLTLRPTCTDCAAPANSKITGPGVLW